MRNRVHHIRELVSKYSIEVHHVPSQDNPADLLSQGIMFDKFQRKFKDFWFKGPEWLTDPSKYPVQKSQVVVNEITSDRPIPVPPVYELFNPERHSSFKKVIRITDYVFRFLQLKCPQLMLPTPEEYWIKQTQRTHYPQVYGILSNPN